jgi:hypothetical protein
MRLPSLHKTLNSMPLGKISFHASELPLVSNVSMVVLFFEYWVQFRVGS